MQTDAAGREQEQLVEAAQQEESEKRATYDLAGRNKWEKTKLIKNQS